MPQEGAKPLKLTPASSYWDKTLGLIAKAVEGPLPSVSEIGRETPDPFRVLVSTIISLRTKDDVTFAASRRLLDRADSPRDMLELSEEEIGRLIYPAGFYRNKAKSLLKICRILIDDYQGKVPKEKDALMSLPGVGLKTTNLVLSQGHRLPAICVDIHVHRIANRMGWVSTKDPDATEKALTRILPVKYWIPINEWLVLFGQKVCRPQSPYCSLCCLNDFCPRLSVARSR